MCEPTTALAIGTALSVASTAASVYAQGQAASAQGEANQRTYESQMQALRFNQANTNYARVQERENLADTMMRNRAAEQRALSTARVASGEAGVSGLSVDALMADISSRAGRDNTAAEINYLRGDRALQAEQFGNYTRAADAINQLTTPQAPDYLGAALRIGQAATNYSVTKAQLKSSN